MSWRSRGQFSRRVGGENVAAPEVERVISTVPGVQEVAVVAKHDTELGHRRERLPRVSIGKIAKAELRRRLAEKEEPA